MKTLAVIAILAGLAGCAPSYQVTSQAGEVAQCGGVLVLGHTAEACVANHVNAGWVRG